MMASILSAAWFLGFAIFLYRYAPRVTFTVKPAAPGLKSERKHL